MKKSVLFLFLYVSILNSIVAQKIQDWSYLQPQKIDNYYGFKNDKNFAVTPYIYDSVKLIKRNVHNNELYAIFKNGKLGLINAYETLDSNNTSNNFCYLINPIYDSIQLCSYFWNCFLNNKIAIIDTYNNELFALNNASIACLLVININKFNFYNKSEYGWGNGKANEKIQNKLRKKNDALVKKNKNFANSTNPLIQYGTKYYEINYNSNFKFIKKEMQISKYLQRVIDFDINKCQYFGNNILSL